MNRQYEHKPKFSRERFDETWAKIKYQSELKDFDIENDDVLGKHLKEIFDYIMLSSPDDIQKGQEVWNKKKHTSKDGYKTIFTKKELDNLPFSIVKLCQRISRSTVLTLEQKENLYKEAKETKSIEALLHKLNGYKTEWLLGRAIEKC